MGELRGRPDTPPEEPDKPASPTPDRARTPDTPSDSKQNPIRDTFRRAEDPGFADPRYERSRSPTGDRRAVDSGRPPESDPDRPPTGEELLQKSPDKPRGSKLRDKLFEKLDDANDSVSVSGDTINALDQALDRPHPTGTYAQYRPHGDAMSGPQPASFDAGMGAAAMFAAGLVIGELAKRSYHKAAELRESWNARNG